MPSAPVQYLSLLYQLLALNDSVLLEHFKIVFLICRMLVHNKQVIFQLRNDKAKIELKY